MGKLMFCGHRTLTLKSTQFSLLGTRYLQDVPTEVVGESKLLYVFWAAGRMVDVCRVKASKKETHVDIETVYMKYLLRNLSYHSGIVHVRTGPELQLQLQPVNTRNFLADKVVRFEAPLFKPFARARAHQAASSIHVLRNVALAFVPVTELNWQSVGPYGIPLSAQADPGSFRHQPSNDVLLSLVPDAGQPAVQGPAVRPGPGEIHHLVDQNVLCGSCF